MGSLTEQHASDRTTGIRRRGRENATTGDRPSPTRLHLGSDVSRLIGNGLGLGYDALNRARIVSRLIEPVEHQLSLMVTYDDAELPRPTRRNSCLFDRTDASSHELLHVRGEQIIRNLAANGIRHRSRNRAEVPLPSALEDQFALVSSDPIPELNANPVLAVDRKANWTPEKAGSDFAPKLAYVVIERGLEAT